MTMTKQAGEPSPGERTDLAVKRYRRRGRLWLAVKLLVVLAIVMLGVVIYLQSRLAMRQIYLPVASRVLGTDVKAAGGRVSLSGFLELNDVVVQGSDSRPAIQVERLLVRVDPGSLMAGGLPALHEVRVERPRLYYAVDEQGRSNWTFIPETEQVERVPQPFPEIRVGLLQVSGFEAEYADATGLQARLDDVDVEARNLAPGSTGTVAVDGRLTLQRPDQGVQQGGSLAMRGELTQHEGGDQLSYNSTLEVALEGLGQGDLLEALALNGTAAGTLTARGATEQQFELTARTSQSEVGRITGELVWDSDEGRRAATLTVNEVSRDFLNPLLLALAPVQLAAGRINADVSLAGVGDQIDFQTAMRAEGLSFIVESADPTPPLNITADQSGSFEPEAQVLRLETAVVDVRRGSEQLLAVDLDQPLTLNIGAEPAAALSAAEARLGVVVNNLTLETARPWLAIAGQPDAAGLTAGTFNADLTLNVGGQGRALDFNGRVTASGLRHAALGGPALELRQTLAGSLTEFERLAIEAGELTVQAGGTRLATVTAGGGLNLADTSGQIDLQLDAPTILATLRRLELMTAPPPAGLSDGNLRATQAVRLASGGSEVRLEGEARIEGISLALRGQNVPLRAELDNVLNYAVAAGRVDLDALTLQLFQGEREAGNAGIEGEWPVAAGGTGRLVCQVRNVDLAPWLVIVRAVEAAALPAIPLELDETLERTADGRFDVKGSIRVGLPSEDEQLALTVQNELRVIGERIERLVIDLAGDGAGAADHARLEGSGVLAEVASLSLDLKVDQLHADPYLAAFERLSGPKTETATPPAEAPTPPPVKVDAKWQVDAAEFRGAQLTDAAGTAQFENGVLVYDMQQGKLANGSLTAQVTLDTARAQPRYSWRVAYQDGVVERLMAAISPELARQLTGLASFQSEGSGEGFGEMLARTLDMTANFSVADGRLSGFDFLDRLSDLTNSETFSDLRFFEFLGTVNFEDGRGEIRQTRVVGEQNKLTFVGSWGLDGSFRIQIDPAINRNLLGGSSGLQQYASLTSDDEGFVRLPVGLIIEGRGGQYAMQPTASVPLAGMGEGGTPDLGQAVRGVLGGVVQQQLEERIGTPGATRGAAAQQSGAAAAVDAVTSDSPGGAVDTPEPGSAGAAAIDALVPDLGVGAALDALLPGSGAATNDDAAATDIPAADAPVTDSTPGDDAVTTGGATADSPSTPTAPAASQTPAPTPTPVPSVEDQLRDTLGNALRDRLLP